MGLQGRWRMMQRRDTPRTHQRTHQEHTYVLAHKRRDTSDGQAAADEPGNIAAKEDAQTRRHTEMDRKDQVKRRHTKDAHTQTRRISIVSRVSTQIKASAALSAGQRRRRLRRHLQGGHYSGRSVDLACHLPPPPGTTDCRTRPP